MFVFVVYVGVFSKCEGDLFMNEFYTFLHLK